MDDKKEEKTGVVEQKQDIVISTEEKRKLIKFDELKIYFGEDFSIPIGAKYGRDCIITVHTPTIGDLLEFGEAKMYESITPFVSNPTQYRAILWDMGIDWNKISDFDFFVMFSQRLDREITSLIFGDFDFSLLFPQELTTSDTQEQKMVLANQEGSVILDEDDYIYLSEYIRRVFDMHPKTEKAKGKTTKQWIIEKDKIDIASKQNEKSGSTLLPLVSSLLNHPGFKYNRTQLKECKITEFMDSVKRLQVMQSAFSLMIGRCSGMVDIKGNEEELNWLRDLH